MTPDIIDLGQGHFLKFVGWAPDRTIPKNAEVYKDMPDNPRCGADIWHNNKDGIRCEGYIGFDKKINADSATWNVECWEPLTLSPSILCRACGDHGFVRSGKWVSA